MIFSTYKFIFLFFSIVFIVYNILCHKKWYVLSKLWLVLASLYFYAFGSAEFFPFFLGSVFGNYVIGKCLGELSDNKIQRKLLLIIGILANVALLGYYKYTDFFITNYNYITKSDITLKHIVLPIGISFFTFQLIAFLVDSYRGETKDYDVVNYLLFITFFPQLIVGPIVHHKDVLHQFANTETYKFNSTNILKGIILFVIGCAKKLLIADVLTEEAQLFFNAVTVDVNYGLINTWYHAIEYTVSYYFDLSGYADMAIGLALMFNIIIPHNFNSPYKARNFQDYWRRWHMTLSRFLGDYIFKSVYKKDVKWRNYYIATMVTFFVSGFWHGAGWTFVVWGLINGIFVCCASYMSRKNVKLPAIIAYPMTAIGIICTRVLFVSDTFKKAWIVIKNMFNIDNYFNLKGELTVFNAFFENNIKLVITCVLAILICWFLPNSKEFIDKYKPRIWSSILIAILFVLCILNMDKVAVFLYFQF